MLAPGLGVFQDLGNNAGLHGYVGQQLRADMRNSNQSTLECGMAMHCPVPGLVEPTNYGVYFFVQALGRYGVTNPADGREYTVQYFERARLERHPENSPPYDLLPGLLGVEATRYRHFPAEPPFEGTPERRHFAETGHALGGAFKRYWEANGGLERFGLPLSGELVEAGALDGRRYTVQYFERARFELHPEWAGTAAEVTLGQLGREALAARRRAAAGFVGVQGAQFVAGADRHAAKLKGVNYWPRDYPWRPWREWDLARVRGELDVAKSLGVNTLRAFVTVDDFGGPAAGWREQGSLDAFLALCRERRIRVVLGLFDSYRKWPAPGWDRWPAAGSAEEARDFAYLRAVVGPRRDDPTVLAYDLYNEPDWVSPAEWSWREHAANRLDWLARVATVSIAEDLFIEDAT